jgi:hypothetical protein
VHYWIKRRQLVPCIGGSLKLNGKDAVRTLSLVGALLWLGIRADRPIAAERALHQMVACAIVSGPPNKAEK